LILVDANIIFYANDELSPQHRPAMAWWDRQLSGTAPVCLCWPVIMAFVRVSTNRRALARPLTIEMAIERVGAWLAQPVVRVLSPTSNHWSIVSDLLVRAQAVGNLVTDAEVAALAIEYGCELQSTDADFSRFPGLKWRNPLA